MAHRPDATTGLSPYELVYGKPGRGPLSILKDTWSNDTGNDPINLSTEYLYYIMLKQDLIDAKEIATKNTDQAQTRYTHQYNLRSRDKEFDVGESVLVLLPDSTNKLKSCWQGPSTIHARVSDYSYRILAADGSLLTLHANHLRKFVNNQRVASAIRTYLG